MEFKCVRVINQMILMSLRLQEEAEARNHLSFRNQTVIVITCGVLFCVPDLLIDLLHLFLFLTQRINGRLLLIKKSKKNQKKIPQKPTTITKKSFFLVSRTYNTNKNTGLSVYFLKCSYQFLCKK